MANRDDIVKQLDALAKKIYLARMMREHQPAAERPAFREAVREIMATAKDARK